VGRPLFPDTGVSFSDEAEAAAMAITHVQRGLLASHVVRRRHIEHHDVVGVIDQDAVHVGCVHCLRQRSISARICDSSSLIRRFLFC
jgi:hypothetical protein